jgi:hypothetical protein
MKRIYILLLSLAFGLSAFAQQTEFADTIAANNAGRYQSKELLKQKQKDYKTHKIITIAKKAIKIGGNKTNNEWYMIDAALSEYGTKVTDGWKEDKLDGFEYDNVEVKDGFDMEYTLYKKKQSEWNTQLDKTGWKHKKADAGKDYVEIQVLKSDKSTGTLYGKLDEIAETKTLLSQGYVSKSDKTSGQGYEEKTVDVSGGSVVLYKKKEVVTKSQNGDSANAAAEQARQNAEKIQRQAEADRKRIEYEQKAEQARIEALNISEAEKNKRIDSLNQASQAAIDAANAKVDEAYQKLAEQQGTIDKLLDTIITIVKAVVVLIILALIVVLVIVFKKRKSNKMNALQNPVNQSTTPPVTVVSQPQQPAPTVQAQPAVTATPKPQPAPVPPVALQPTQQPKPTLQPPKFPVLPAKTAFAEDADEWIVVGASVIGNSHISAKLPCQDNHKYESLGEGWGIAVVSDGAGSAEYSHFGSKIVAERSVARFKAVIEKEGWIKNSELPSDDKWKQIAYSTLKAVRDELETAASAKNISLKSLYATAIVVIHSPVGILATHIGDGRAGYKNHKGEWKPLIIPHKGDEANQTIFLPSDFWNVPNYVMSEVAVPQSIVVREQPFAFTLMSDGCECTAWLFNQKDEKTGKFYDPNLPYSQILDSLGETLQSFRNDKVALKEREEKWANFITSGNKTLEEEQDDKTMILGVVHL